MDFNYGTELLQLCETYQMPIWQVMKKRETKDVTRSSHFRLLDSRKDSSTQEVRKWS